MNKLITCGECGIEYYSETIVPRESFRHVYPDIVKLESELAEAQAEVEMLRLENASLMFIVKNQRCCRNCGNHWSANFEVCGLGEDTVTGRYCREHDLIHWRPMEYRRAKEAAERGK